MMKKYYLRVGSLVASTLYDALLVQEHLNKSRRVFFFDYSDFTIQNGSLFNYLSINGKTYSLNGKLVYITQQYAKSFIEIPMGWKTVCVIEFYGDFDIIDKIPIIESWYDRNSDLDIEIGFDESLIAISIVNPLNR